MYGPLSELFIALVLLYAIAAVRFVRRDAIVLCAWPWNVARLTMARVLPGSARVGVYLATPPPPLGELVEARFWPLAISPDGVSTIPAVQLGRDASLVPPPTFVPFSAIHRATTSGATLLINDDPFLRCANETEADHFAGLIDQLRRSPMTERGAQLHQAVADSLDEDVFVRALARARAAAASVRWPATVLFVFLFTLTPVAILRAGFGVVWPILLVTLVFLWIVTILTAVRVHRRAFPARGAERRRGVIAITIAVVGALRAHELLTRHTLGRFHPLLLTAQLCAPQRFRKFAQDLLRDLVYPRPIPADEASSPAARTTAWLRAAERTACEALLRRHEIDPAEFVGVPAQRDPESQSVCPRCRCEFLHATGICPDCELPLIRFVTRPA